MNERHKFYNLEGMPKDSIKELVDNVAEDDCAVLILTNGVGGYSENESPVRSFVAAFNPQVAATAIYNLANFGNHEMALKVCQDLRDIADNAERSIRIDMQKQTAEN